MVSTQLMIDTFTAHTQGTPLPPGVPSYGPSYYPILPFGPVIDGSSAGLPDMPQTLFNAGQFNKVPLIIGSNKNEGSLFEIALGAAVPNFKFPASDESLSNAMNWFLDSTTNTTQFLSVYTAEEFESYGDYTNDARAAHAIRDALFYCSDKAIATAFAKYNVPAYVYSFALDLNFMKKAGDFHAAELPFVWDNLEGADFFADRPLKMAHVMSTRWTNFATCSNPDGCDSRRDRRVDVPNWPVFDPATGRQYYVFRIPFVVQGIQANNMYPDDYYPSDAKCDFWYQQTFPWHSLQGL
jgi:carboxylesterase type B